MWTYSCSPTRRKQREPLVISNSGLGASSDNVGTIEYLVPHQATKPPFEAVAPETVHVLAQLSTPTRHEVPLCPLPYASAMLILITRSLSLTIQMHILPRFSPGMMNP